MKGADWTWLVKKIEGFLRLAGRRPPPASSSTDRRRSTRRDPSSHVLRSARQKAISHLVAKHAADDEHVESFRNQVLDGELVDENESADWIERQSHETPPNGVERPSGKLYFVRLPSLRVLSVPTFNRTRLGRLRKLAERLSRDFRWWNPFAPVWVLAGGVPPVQILDVHSFIDWRYPALSRITLTIDPGLPPGEVEFEYRRAQELMSGGREFRETSERRLRLITFVYEHHELKSTSDRIKAWNKEFPQWSYDEQEQVSNFLRDVRGAERHLREPKFMPTWPEGFGKAWRKRKGS